MSLTQTATRNRNRLISASEKDAQRIITAYGLMAERIKDKVDLLMLELKDTEYTVASVKKSKRYKELVTTLSEELARFWIYMEVELQSIKARSAEQGKADAINQLKERVNGT